MSEHPKLKALREKALEHNEHYKRKYCVDSNHAQIDITLLDIIAVQREALEATVAATYQQKPISQPLTRRGPEQALAKADELAEGLDDGN